jgi:hypothetical protein
MTESLFARDGSSKSLPILLMKIFEIGVPGIEVASVL